MPEQLAGNITQIIYRNEANGFTVLELEDEDGGACVAVGTMPLATPGERALLLGEWTEHREYGHQFKAQSYSALTPASLIGLERYLAGLIKGVGETTARNIVARFGEETLSVLEFEGERLLEVDGIGETRAKGILASFHEQRLQRDVMLALQGYGITLNQAYKLFSIYGDDCVRQVRENPYQLILDIANIGFKTADKIAAQAGFAPDSSFRIAAGIQYTLSLAAGDGHTYLPAELLATRAAELLALPEDLLRDALEEMLVRGRLACADMEEHIAVFPPQTLYAERFIAAKLPELHRQVFYGQPDLRSELAFLEQESGVTLAALQREAVLTALQSGVTVITGGPGTGKTTIIQFILKLFTKLSIRFELCAPTGRASKRITEATGHEAKTLHRLLESGYGEGFQRDDQNPLETDAVILDEMSMVDVHLFFALLRALPQARLILVGDVDQLPSIGAGNVLSDIIKSGVFPVIRLSEIYRQTERSMIVEGAHRVNRGDMPKTPKDSDFTFEEPFSAAEMIARVIALSRRPPFSGITGKDIQVLAPMKRGALGVQNLNLQLQQALNPPAPGSEELLWGEMVFRTGDKVMQIKNNYQLEWTKEQPIGATWGKGCFNGDMGVIVRIDPGERVLSVLFDDDRLIHYDFTQLDELDLAYCISIHKSQGSEFPAILLPLAAWNPKLMTRNLLYTAITRARKHVHLIGRAAIVRGMVENNRQRRRYSALLHFLRENGDAPS